MQANCVDSCITTKLLKPEQSNLLDIIDYISNSNVMEWLRGKKLERIEHQQLTCVHTRNVQGFQIIPYRGRIPPTMHLEIRYWNLAFCDFQVFGIFYWDYQMLYLDTFPEIIKCCIWDPEIRGDGPFTVIVVFPL